ncbi:hypothetical protein [Desertibacillus haloalkaliphilus]|uniref:hypothetical protein n=1 Tax=Desertibacillus haloalkaliphilus TaxID=1328930 RepID=UPI001C278781|nr:hypothetical protein [Desertibacillus haloalkaliphilus]MBU8908527.1 hypothetical protein [Desertibacillus haloalkaliphilus]
MSDRFCGVCNKYVPIDEEQLGLQEQDGTWTSYHIGCEYGTKGIEPCEDCGKHRLFCTECGEPPFDE